MMPISQRKNFRIPHGLAAVAAAVCLLFALFLDHGELHEQLRAENGETALEVAASLKTEEEAMELAERARQVKQSAPRRSINPQWFPLLIRPNS